MALHFSTVQLMIRMQRKFTFIQIKVKQFSLKIFLLIAASEPLFGNSQQGIAQQQSNNNEPFCRLQKWGNKQGSLARTEAVYCGQERQRKRECEGQSYCCCWSEREAREREKETEQAGGRPGRLMEGSRLVICNMVYVLDNAFCTQWGTHLCERMCVCECENVCERACEC